MGKIIILIDDFRYLSKFFLSSEINFVIARSIPKIEIPPRKSIKLIEVDIIPVSQGLRSLPTISQNISDRNINDIDSKKR